MRSLKKSSSLLRSLFSAVLKLVSQQIRLTLRVRILNLLPLPFAKKWLRKNLYPVVENIDIREVPNCLDMKKPSRDQSTFWLNYGVDLLLEYFFSFSGMFKFSLDTI